MGWVFPLLTFFFGIVVMVVVVIVKIKGSQAISKIDIPENAPIIEIGSRKKFTNGYSRGIIKEQLPCKNGCTRFIFIPLDWEQGEYKKRPGEQIIVVKNEFIKRLARGEDSSRREIVKCIELNKTDIPEKLWGTNLEKDMTLEGQKAYMKSIAGTMAGNTHKAVVGMIEDTTYVGVTKEWIQDLKEKNNAMSKISNGIEMEDKK